MDENDRLGALCGSLLDYEASPGDLSRATNDLYALLLRVSGLAAEEVDPSVAVETLLPAGKAIAPIEAARCLLDLWRTQAFAAGVIAAVGQRRAVAPSRPVHVLYAGCGPFATLLLPALTRFRPDELQCTLIDFHQRSTEAAHRVIAGLGFENSVRAIETADATTYRIPEETTVDVVVVECLQRGLSSEPQVAITWNLVSQVGPEVTLVPEAILLDVVTVDGSGTGPHRSLVRLADEPIFTLSRDGVQAWGPFDATTSTLPARPFAVPRSVEPPDMLALATTIRVHPNHWLTDYRSGLTHPHPLDGPARYAAATQLRCEYRLDLPGISVVRSVGPSTAST